MTTLSNLGDDRITAVGLFVEAYSGLSCRLQAQLAEHGMAAIEFEVLLRLARSPLRRLRMTHLAAQTSLSTSGITRVVDRLERRGLVERVACAEDRRSLYAMASEAGLAKLSDALPGHLAVIDEWFTGRLAPAELAPFLDALRRIRDGVAPGTVAGATETGTVAGATRDGTPLPSGA